MQIGHSHIGNQCSKNYTVSFATVVNGWLINFQVGHVTKSVVIQSSGQNRVEELMFGIESVLAELEGAVQ